MAYNTISDLFKGICDAIRYKTADTQPINHQDIPDKIMSIDGGGSSEYQGFYNYGELEVETISFDYKKLSELAVDTPTKAKDVKVFTNLKEKGITSSSTKEQIRDALLPDVEKLCEMLGLHINLININNRVEFYLGIDGDDSDTNVIFLAMSGYSNYVYRLLEFEILLSDAGPYIPPYTHRAYWDLNSYDEDYCEYRTYDVFTNDLYLNYYETNNGDLLFDLYRKNRQYSRKFCYVKTKVHTATEDFTTVLSIGRSRDTTSPMILRTRNGKLGIYNWETSCGRANRAIDIANGEYINLIEDNDIVTNNALHVTCSLDDLDKTFDPVLVNNNLKMYSNRFGIDAGNMLLDRYGNKYLVLLNNQYCSYIYDITEEENET